MVKWELAFSKQALKDAKKVKAAGLKPGVEELLALLEKDPFQNPPGFTLGLDGGAKSRDALLAGGRAHPAV